MIKNRYKVYLLSIQNINSNSICLRWLGGAPSLRWYLPIVWRYLIGISRRCFPLCSVLDRQQKSVTNLPAVPLTKRQTKLTVYVYILGGHSYTLCLLVVLQCAVATSTRFVGRGERTTALRRRTVETRTVRCHSFPIGFECGWSRGNVNNKNYACGLIHPGR